MARDVRLKGQIPDESGQESDGDELTERQKAARRGAKTRAKNKQEQAVADRAPVTIMTRPGK